MGKYMKAFNNDNLVFDGQVSEFLIWQEDDGFFYNLIKDRESDTIFSKTDDGDWKFLINELNLSDLDNVLQTASEGVLEVCKHIKHEDSLENSNLDEILRRLEGRIDLLRELVDFRMGRY